MLVLRYSESAMDEVRPKLVQLGDARTDTLKPENRPEAVILRVASLLSPIRALVLDSVSSPITMKMVARRLRRLRRR